MRSIEALSLASSDGEKGKFVEGDTQGRDGGCWLRGLQRVWGILKTLEMEIGCYKEGHGADRNKC